MEQHVFPRVLGHYGSEGGPLLVIVAGLHGNEPMGCWAAQRVLQWLAKTQPAWHGQLLVLAGNRAALAGKQRYIQKDLNRIWDDAQMAAARASTLDLSVSEYQEQAELLAALDGAFAGVDGPATILDLHTSSSPSAPFGIVGESPENRSFAKGLGVPVPLVYALDAQFDGPLLKYLGKLGHRTLAFEAGQHEDPNAVLLHEALCYLMLAANGHVAVSDLPDVEGLRGRLAQASGDIPRHLEVFYRHAITPADAFTMTPGYANFSAVSTAEKLATEATRDVLAPEDCRVLLPLYQPQGEDGFFLVREHNTD